MYRICHVVDHQSVLTDLSEEQILLGGLLFIRLLPGNNGADIIRNNLGFDENMIQ